MNIVFLLTQDIESPSGFGRYFPLAKNLVKRGHKVSILTLHPLFNSLKQKKFEQDGVDIWYVAQMHVSKYGNYKTDFPTSKFILSTINATISLFVASKSLTADIIHIGKPHPMNGIAGLFAHFFNDSLLFLDCDDYEVGSGRFNAEWQKYIVAFFEQSLPKYVHLITTNTDFMKHKLETWGISSEQIIYLPNGVDLDRFRLSNHEEVDNLRTKLGLIGHRVIVYIGSLSYPSHPVNLLLKAFKKVHMTIPDTKLVIVGGGDQYENLKKQTHFLGLDNSVIFCGRISPIKIPIYYQLADVSVDPNNNDDAARGRSPLKIFESWASKVPIVTSDVGNRRKLLDSPPAGVIAIPGDTTSLSNCILSVLQQPDVAEELRRYGLDRAEQFSWNRISNILEVAYIKSLANKH